MAFLGTFTAAAPDPVWFVMASAFGLVFGSFITALSYRLPRGESIAHGRSRCPACGHGLSARDLVPVFSWMFHKGACRQCSAKISWRYPAIELVMAALFVTAVAIERDPARLGLLLAMTPAMMALAVIDMEHERLPNVLIAVLAVLALVWRWVADGEVLMGLAAAAAALVAGVLLDAGYRALAGRGGLGMGDAKLIAVGALALPLGPFLLFLAMAGFAGVAFGAAWQRVKGRRGFPFGPALLAGLWTGLACGDFLWRGLLSLSRG